LLPGSLPACCDICGSFARSPRRAPAWHPLPQPRWAARPAASRRRCRCCSRTRGWVRCPAAAAQHLHAMRPAPSGLTTHRALPRLLFTHLLRIELTELAAVQSSSLWRWCAAWGCPRRWRCRSRRRPDPRGRRRSRTRRSCRSGTGCPASCAPVTQVCVCGRRGWGHGAACSQAAVLRCCHSAWLPVLLCSHSGRLGWALLVQRRRAAAARTSSSGRLPCGF
jgi:hypothetical protein